MGLFTKKEEKKDNLLPELPDMPKLPELPEEKEEKAIPAFPKMSPTTGMAAIKSTILEPQEKRTMELGSFSQHSFSKTSEKEPIYIRLDKFKEASKNFETIQHKLMEIETSFRKLKEIKEKEDQELLGWETELQELKSRIGSIDISLFNKLGN